MQISLSSRSSGREAMRFLALAILGSAVIAASARIAMPMWPVPATLQTLAVLALGALGGARLGVASVLFYLVEGAMGLPVFAAGAAGPAVLMGPTAGFLFGFLPGAWIAAQARGGWLRAGATLLVAHLAMFIPGVLWLSGFVGLGHAVAVGFLIFVPGTVVKTALALAGVKLARR